MPERNATMLPTPTKKKTRLGCAPGCQVALLVVAVVLAVGGYFGLRPIREIKRLEQDLLDRYTTVPEYLPARDGAIAPERMEVFLAVRRALLERTGNVQETYARIDEAMAQDDLSPGEGVSTMKDLLSALPRMVEFYGARNGELLAQGMGLGEYFYVFVMAYGERLCPLDEGEVTAGDCEFVTSRTTRELTQVLRNQLEEPTAPPSGAMATALQREIAALERGDVVLPWQRGLPAAVAASLAPYRERLEPLFCPATRQLELGQKNQNIGGFGD